MKKVNPIGILRIHPGDVATSVGATAPNANDRPPVVGTLGRESGEVRLHVVHHTDKVTRTDHVHQFTQSDATVYTDSWRGNNALDRCHEVVCHKIVRELLSFFLYPRW